MPRTKKPTSLEEQLIKVDSDIEATKKTLSRLKRTKKELEDKINLNRLTELNQLIIAKGKSIEDVKEILNRYEE